MRVYFLLISLILMSIELFGQNTFLDEANRLSKIVEASYESNQIKDAELIDSILSLTISNLNQGNINTFFGLVYQSFFIETQKSTSKIFLMAIEEIITNHTFLETINININQQYRTYEFHEIILYLKFADFALNKTPKWKQLFTDNLTNFSKSTNADISSLSKDLLNTKFEFIQFINWAKLSSDEKDKVSKPYFSCSFYKKDEDKNSMDCYYSLYRSFLEFLKEQDFEIQEIENRSMKGWDNIEYKASSKINEKYYFIFVYESEITPNGNQGYSKIYIK